MLIFSRADFESSFLRSKKHARAAIKFNKPVHGAYRGATLFTVDAWHSGVLCISLARDMIITIYLFDCPGYAARSTELLNDTLYTLYCRI